MKTKSRVDHFEHEINVQQQMVGDMKIRGQRSTCGRDPTTGEPLTLGMMYDRYAICLCVLWEKEQI